MAYKTVDTERASTTALADDPHLVVALTANKKYRFRFVWWQYCVNASPDIKFAVTFSGTTTNIYGAVFRTGHEVDLAAINTALYGGSPLTEDTPIVLAAGDAPGNMPFIIEGTIEVGASGGNLALQWAQNSSSATNLTVRRGSYLEVVEIV